MKYTKQQRESCEIIVEQMLEWMDVLTAFKMIVLHSTKYKWLYLEILFNKYILNKSTTT